jgi:hypothetical protein
MRNKMHSRLTTQGRSRLGSGNSSGRGGLAAHEAVTTNLVTVTGAAMLVAWDVKLLPAAPVT